MIIFNWKPQSHNGKRDLWGMVPKTFQQKKVKKQDSEVSQKIFSCHGIAKTVELVGWNLASVVS